MRQSSYKREKYTFTSANLRVVNAILNANRDNTNIIAQKPFLPHCLQFDSIPGHDTSVNKTIIKALVGTIMCFFAFNMQVSIFN